MPTGQYAKTVATLTNLPGATITPRAVVGAVKNVSLYYQRHQQELFNQPLNCQGNS